MVEMGEAELPPLHPPPLRSRLHCGYLLPALSPSGGQHSGLSPSASMPTNKLPLVMATPSLKG
jgi:hypothetical protein